MFSVLKVRDDVKPGDYRDPGWFKHPAGSVAREYTGELEPAVRAPSPAADANTLKARKPTSHQGH
jgi:hypothetical protein